MDIDVRQADVDKYTTDENGNVVVRLVESTGDNPIEDSVNVLQLAKEAFTKDDEGNIAVRTTGREVGVAIAQIAFFIDDADGSRIGWKEEGGDLVLTIIHGLETINIVVEFYEDGLNGSVDVPWSVDGINTITACIPLGSGFAGEVKIISRALPASRATSETFSEEFKVSKFVLIDGTDRYRATFLHGLGSNILDFSFYLDNNCPNLICASNLTASTLSIEVTEDQRFGGSVIIEKAT